MTNDLLTAGEIAVLLRCSKALVYRLMNGIVPGRPALPHVALGRKKVVRRFTLEAWLQQNECGAMLSGDSDRSALGRVQ